MFENNEKNIICSSFWKNKKRQRMEDRQMSGSKSRKKGEYLYLAKTPVKFP